MSNPSGSSKQDLIATSQDLSIKVGFGQRQRPLKVFRYLTIIVGALGASKDQERKRAATIGSLLCEERCLLLSLDSSCQRACLPVSCSLALSPREVMSETGRLGQGQRRVGQSRPSGPAVLQYSTAFLQFEMEAFAKARCPSQSRGAPSEAGMLPPEAHRLEKSQQCDFGSHCLSGSEA